MAQNPSLWGGTNLFGLYKGEHPQTPPPPSPAPASDTGLMKTTELSMDITAWVIWLCAWSRYWHEAITCFTRHTTTELTVCASLLNLVWFYQRIAIDDKRNWHEKSPGNEMLRVWCAWVSCGFYSRSMGLGTLWRLKWRLHKIIRGSLGREESNMADERDVNSSRVVEG